jgi:hypothetical protein
VNTADGHATATIDVERLAREAGIGIESFADYKRSNPHYIAKPEQMRAYAALVLEEAARRLMDMDFETTRHNYYHVAANAVRDLKPK